MINALCKIWQQLLKTAVLNLVTFVHTFLFSCLDYSQKDVADSIKGCMDADISQTTVSRYETIKLSARNMVSFLKKN